MKTAPANHSHLEVIGLEHGDGLDDSGHVGGAALVPGHAGHDAAGLDVRAASVVGDSLAHQHQSLLHFPALGNVLHPDHAALGKVIKMSQYMMSHLRQV